MPNKLISLMMLTGGCNCSSRREYKLKEYLRDLDRGETIVSRLPNAAAAAAAAGRPAYSAVETKVSRPVGSFSPSLYRCSYRLFPLYVGLIKSQPHIARIQEVLRVLRPVPFKKPNSEEGYRATHK